MIAHTNALKFSVPTLYMVICAGKLLMSLMKHIPHLNWEIWGSSSCVSSEPTNVSIFKVIKNSISCIPILISDLVGQSFECINCVIRRSKSKDKADRWTKADRVNYELFCWGVDCGF